MRRLGAAGGGEGEAISIDHGHHDSAHEDAHEFHHHEGGAGHGDHHDLHGGIFNSAVHGHSGRVSHDRGEEKEGRKK